jgi:hypothetical protein
MTFFPNIPPVQHVADATITAYQVVRTTTSGRVIPATASLTTLPFNGFALTGATSGGSVPVLTAGFINPLIFNLGNGDACAVGVNSSGVPVRATSASCVSAPNWIGTCDSFGTVTFSPRRDTVFNVLDWGLDPTGVVACDSSFQTVLSQTNTGDVVLFPQGIYKFTQTITMPRLQMGIEIRSDTGNAAHGIFTPTQAILRFSNASGDGIRVCTDPTTNSHGFLTLRNLTIEQTNSANRSWNSEATESWLKGGAAVGMIGGQRLECIGIETTGSWRFGIAIDGGELCSIEDCDMRNGTSPEVDGYQSFGVWLAGGTRGMSVADATNVNRISRVHGNAPSFLFLLDTSAANSIEDCMTNINPNCPAGFAMVRGGSYINVKNGYAEGDNNVGAAMFYFTGGQSINFRIEGGFYTGVGVPFARLGPNPFGIAGQAAGLEIIGVDLACDWIVNSNYITNCHLSLGNILSGDIASVRSAKMYDVTPGMTTGYIANTSDGYGYAMGTHANPKAQHHWALRQYGSPMHRDGTEPFVFREFWIDAQSKFRTLETPYSSITGFQCQNSRAIEYVFTEDDGPNLNVASLVVNDRVFGFAHATISAVWAGDETKNAVWEIRQRFRRLTGGNITLVGTLPTLIWSDVDSGGVGFTQPDFTVDTSAQTVRVRVFSRTDGQVYYIVNMTIEGVHP